MAWQSQHNNHTCLSTTFLKLAARLWIHVMLVDAEQLR